CHAGPRHLLHRRADIFGEGFLAPGDAGRFVGRGVVESLESAGLATVDAVERGTELGFGVRPNVVTGGAQSLEDLLAGGGLLRQCRAGRSRNNDSGNHQCPHHFSPLSNSARSRPRLGAGLGSTRNPAHKRPSRLEPTCDRNHRAVRMALSACSVNGQRENLSRCHDAGIFLRNSAISCRVGGINWANREARARPAVGRRSARVPPAMPPPDQAVLARRERIVAALRAIVPGEGVIAAEREMRPYESDGLTAYRQLPMVVVLPETTAQVSRVLAFCHAEGIKVVPRGAGTSLSAGPLPLTDGVLLGMAKFNRIREIALANRLAVVEPGVTNLAVTEAVEHAGFYYAPDPSSQIACTIGGNVAENSGGVHCLKYGMTTNNL